MTTSVSPTSPVSLSSVRRYRPGGTSQIRYRPRESATKVAPGAEATTGTLAPLGSADCAVPAATANCAHWYLSVAHAIGAPVGLRTVPWTMPFCDAAREPGQ